MTYVRRAAQAPRACQCTFGVTHAHIGVLAGESFGQDGALVYDWGAGHARVLDPPTSAPASSSSSSPWRWCRGLTCAPPLGLARPRLQVLFIFVASVPLTFALCYFVFPMSLTLTLTVVSVGLVYWAWHTAHTLPAGAEIDKKKNTRLVGSGRERRAMRFPACPVCRH